MLPRSAQEVVESLGQRVELALASDRIELMPALGTQHCRAGLSDGVLAHLGEQTVRA